MTGTTTDGVEHNWKMAKITVKSYGPRYVIRADEEICDGDEWCVAETVRFNGFKLGLDGRAEVEYTEFELTDEPYPTGLTANFYDPNHRSAEGRG